MVFDTTQPAYTGFRNILKERTENVVAWVGAGLSAPAGIPSWQELRSRLCNTLRSKASEIEDDSKQGLLTQAGAAEGVDRLWTAFQILKGSLGNASYRDAIREELRHASSCNVPTGYLRLWQLGVSGIVTLNIDRLATRAYNHVFSGRSIPEFIAGHASGLMHLLRSPEAFIANLHGVVENADSWVFTDNDLQALFHSRGYRNFVSTCLQSRVVLFIGITADDLAVGGHLANLISMGIDCGSHYWLTDRCDGETDRWAESCGIRVIRYRNVDGGHSEVEEFFEDLRQFMPEEEEPAPIISGVDTGSSPGILPPRELEVARDVEAIRRSLNAEASRILADSNEDSYRLYQEFRVKYRHAIHRAWDVTTIPPDNLLMGYQIDDVIGTGAFGNVYRALDDSGRAVAAKVLHIGSKDKEEFVQSFRRGVRSMRILVEAGVHGVVACKAAYEIPAFVVMDLVDGPSLQEAVASKLLQGWRQILRVAVDAVRVIHNSHRLSQRVLHRDIRPANIMLRNGWEDPDNGEVVILDFDLSWHVQAMEVSVSHSGTMNGYLAPEQLQPSPKYSTRNAAVDAFGIGMTLFFMVSREAPIPDHHLHGGWADLVIRKCGGISSPDWQSLPNRFARLILSATRHEQPERWDVAQILRELERLHMTITEPWSVVAPDLFAEELLCRLCGVGYAQEGNTDTLVVDMGTGLAVKAEPGGTDEQRVCFTFQWQTLGSSQHQRIKRWLGQLRRALPSIVRDSIWTNEGLNIDTGQIVFGISTTAQSISHRTEQCFATLKKVAAQFRMSV